MDDTDARITALIAAAIATAGQALQPPALIRYAGQLTPWLNTATPARMTLTIEGDPMPLTIDSQGAKAVLLFTDRAGDPVNPPDGTQAQATSSNPAVLTVGDPVPGTDQASGAVTIEFPLSEVSAGVSTLTVHAAGPDGALLLGPDAATPITDADPVDVTVNPGAAAAERFTVPAAAATAAPAASGLGSAQAAQGQPGDSAGQPGEQQQQSTAATDAAGLTQPGQPGGQ